MELSLLKIYTVIVREYLNKVIVLTPKNLGGTMCTAEKQNILEL